jgi:hypothetical protein
MSCGPYRASVKSRKRNAADVVFERKVCAIELRFFRDVLAGKPVIKGTRLAVELFCNYLRLASPRKN